MKHIVALSGGKDSVCLALALKEREPQDYEYICTPTGDELPEMIEHWVKLEKLLGQPIKRVTDKNRTIMGMALEQKCLPNYRMRWCTRMLKIVPYQEYLLNSAPAVSYIGIRADEVDQREGVDHSSIEGITNRYPLVDDRDWETI